MPRKNTRPAAVALFGLLLSILPLAASAAPEGTPAESPASTPVEVHQTKLTGVDPAQYGGSVAAALAAYWTPARQREAEANSADEERKPANGTQRVLALEPQSDADLPAAETRKIGQLFYTPSSGGLASCTAFLVPRGPKAGVIQTAAHCVLNPVNGAANTNFTFHPDSAGTTSVFPVSDFVNGEWSATDAFGPNVERDFAFGILLPDQFGGTTASLGAFPLRYVNPFLGYPMDVVIAGHPGGGPLVRACGKEIGFARDDDQLAHWKVNVPDPGACQTVGGMSGGPVLQIVPNPCSLDVTYFAVANHSSVASPTSPAEGPWNYRQMKASYEFVRDFQPGSARTAQVKLTDPAAVTADDACEGPTAGPGAIGPETSFFNRTPPVPGMPDWSKAGYLGGEPLPGDADVTDDEACKITPAELDTQYGVRGTDQSNDTAGLQRAIDDIKSGCTPQAGYRRLSLITLPAGRIDITRQISVDASFLILRGEGAEDRGTKFVFRPDANTRYDTLVNGRWDQDKMVAGSGSDVGTGGWIWPGRGLFRVQTRDLADRYQDDWAAAPANRKDIFEGSINQHWASGIKVVANPADAGYSARQGDRLVRLDAKADLKKFTLGGYAWVGAANSVNFYHQQGVGDDQLSLMENLHMRQQMFRVAAIDATARTITLDRPLEYDLPVTSTSDGSAPLAAIPYASKVTPLKVVEGVGFENFSFTQDLSGMPKLGGGDYDLTAAQAVHNYGNMAPEYAMHGIVFKWAANDWVRGVKATMTGSHPIVTEDALNLQIERNSFDGAWNKGKGGNGYLRGSRVWSSLYAYNLSRNLRHFTFQWSASGNVAFRNDLDSDLNLHGGWERANLFEQNTVRVPFDHRSASCETNCGGEGGEIDEGTWYPIWWAAGPKAVKWAGSSGPQNVFYNNLLTKQATANGPYTPYSPYGSRLGTAYQFGSNLLDPTRFQPLSQGGYTLQDWGGHETVDYTAGHGVVERDMGGRPSLFLSH